jgi:hypothetical protein
MGVQGRIQGGGWHPARAPPYSFNVSMYIAHQGRIQDFKLAGAHLKKLRRTEGGAKIFGVFRVKNHDFTPKNHIFPILGEAREIFGVFHECGDNNTFEGF